MVSSIPPVPDGMIPASIQWHLHGNGSLEEDEEEKEEEEEEEEGNCY